MAAFEVFTWVVLGAALSLTLPGPRDIQLPLAMFGALFGGIVARALEWQALIGTYSVSALLLAGIAASLVLGIYAAGRRLRER